jgi:hypothetical protein
LAPKYWLQKIVHEMANRIMMFSKRSTMKRPAIITAAADISLPPRPHMPYCPNARSGRVHQNDAGRDQLLKRNRKGDEKHFFVRGLSPMYRRKKASYAHRTIVYGKTKVLKEVIRITAKLQKKCARLGA